MDFFSRLRQLSLAVERDVADIQQTFDLPRSEDDSTDGAALLLLQEIKNDVIGVKESAQHSFRRLCEVPEFVEVVNAACALVERERVLLAETEEHLQQYGYTPVLTPGVEREGGGGDANGELGATSQDTEDSSPVKCESQPSPASSGDSPIAPVLHSFAFAKNFSSRYKSANCGQVPRMYSDQTVETSRKVAQQDISIGTNKFDGIDTDSPIPPVLQTPGIKNIGQVKSKTVIQGNANGIVSDDDSPVPPIMQTPGFKHIRKMDRNGITDESSFQCPVGPVISGHVIKGGALADDSPLPPVMQTPGVKQLNRFVDKNGDNVDLPAEPQLDTPEPPEMTVHYKVAVDGKALPAKPTLSSRFDLMDTPEPPKMTFNYKDYVKLMASRQPQSQTTGMSHKPGQHKTAGAPHVPNPSATTSMYSPWTQSHGGAVAVVTPICHHAQSQNMTAVEPSLAAQYQRAMTEDLVFETPRTKEPTSFSNGFLISMGLVEDEDEDFPEPPERTVKLQDLVNLGILAPDGTRETVGSTTNEPRGAGAPLSTTSAPLRGSGIPLRSTKASTTTALVHHPHPCNSPPSSQVAEVSEDEYKYLPNYVTRSLPLERFNTAVRSINEILTDTSGDQRVRESCLHPILGSHHTKPFFLAMLSLGRLHCDSDHMCGEPVYVLADL